MLTPEELYEEFAWGKIMQAGWIPTPMLLMWYVKLVRDCDEQRREVEPVKTD